MISNDVLEAAVRFHGHLGPFLILGLRAGTVGTDYLGKDYFKQRARIGTALTPPRSCFIDGIQFASGCTTGKGNLETYVSNDVSVEFVKGEHKISLFVRNDVLKMLDQVTSDKHLERMGREILRKSDEELFLIKRE